MSILDKLDSSLDNKGEYGQERLVSLLVNDRAGACVENHLTAVLDKVPWAGSRTQLNDNGQVPALHAYLEAIYYLYLKISVLIC